MVKKKYANDIKKELNQRLINKANNEGLKECKYSIFSIIDIDISGLEDVKNPSIVFTFDIIEDFELPAYSNISLKSKSSEVTNDEISQMIEQILSQRAEFKPVKKVVEKGDYVKCSYTGKIENKLISELVPDKVIYGTQKSTWEEAGAENTPGVKSVVEGLIGMEEGQNKDVLMEFPSDFEVKELAGKIANYEIQVEEVREKILPKLDQAFFDSIQVKNEAEFRTQIDEMISKRKQNEVYNLEQKQVVEYLNESVKIELPISGLKQEEDLLLEDLRNKNRSAGGSKGTDIINELDEDMKKMAASRLKSKIILNKIAHKEKLKVDNDDLSRAVLYQSSITGKKPEKLVKEIQKDRNRIDQMKQDLLISKSLKLILDSANRSIEK